LEEPHSETVRERMNRWVDEGVILHTPLLAQYEIATALTRKLSKGRMSKEAVDEALTVLDELEVVFHIVPNNARAIKLALAMNRSRASDAAYLALAEELSAVVWTLDKKLGRNHAVRHLTKLID
jgi:predicted nucleic acid-binding protein